MSCRVRAVSKGGCPPFDARFSKSYADTRTPAMLASLQSGLARRCSSDSACRAWSRGWGSSPYPRHRTPVQPAGWAAGSGAAATGPRRYLSIFPVPPPKPRLSAVLPRKPFRSLPAPGCDPNENVRGGNGRAPHGRGRRHGHVRGGCARVWSLTFLVSYTGMVAYRGNESSALSMRETGISRRPHNAYSVGRTNKVSSVAEIKPPMTTVASGF